MTVRMLINATAPNELRIAIVEDGELFELDIEAAEKSTVKGNIYKGKVRNVEGSLEAAFVDFGQHKQGFLPFSEISDDQFYRKWDGKGRPKITDVVRRDQDIVVQVAKDAVGDKGATLTTYLSLAGRYVVLMPGSDAGGISRKIDDDKVRKRIRSMASKINKPEDCGFIVRTAGLNQTRLGIQRDLDKVSAQLAKIRESAKIARAPSILYAEPDLIARTLRDYFNEDIDEVWIDTKDEYDAAKEYFDEVMPELAEKVHYYQNPIPVFAYYRVEEQIEATFERRVGLPSGGSIVVDQTEALVAIDVNSGKMTSEGDHEGTVYKTNTEAAEEIARQLRLRDLGGIVVVDFIDMEQTKNKRAVEKVLTDASADDKARWKISRINSKGLCVLTRQRIRQGMKKAFQKRCEICGGTGWMRTAESHSLSLLRRIETRLAQGGVGETRVVTHKETAEYLSNHKRSELLALEREYRCKVVISARAEMDRGKDDVTFMSHGELLQEITDKLPPRESKKGAGSRRRRKKKSRSDRPDRSDRSERSPRSDRGDRGDRSEDRAASDGGGKSRRRKSRGRAEDREAAASSSKRDAAQEEGPTPLAARGNTTFTGRPSPEQLARLKAESKARRARAQAKANGEDPDAAFERVMAEFEAEIAAAKAESAEAATEEADVAAAEAEGDEDEDEDEGAPKKKSRRSRRGRRRGKGGKDAADADDESAEAASDDDGDDAEPAEVKVDEPDEADDAEEPAEAAPKKKRTRSRRPRKTAAKADGDGDGDGDGPPARAKATEKVPDGPSLDAVRPPDPDAASARKSLLDRIFGSR